MSRNTTLLLTVLVALSPALHAQDSFLLSLQRETGQDQWREVGADMSPGQYGEALRHNRRLAQETVTSTIVSFGVPKMGVNVMGAAIALAVADLKVPLNKSRTLALKIDDAADQSRSALLQMKLDW